MTGDRGQGRMLVVLKIETLACQGEGRSRRRAAGGTGVLP